jgi:enamine deaminase RidA (YjgF/YER057c/UK114 family)
MTHEPSPIARLHNPPELAPPTGYSHVAEVRSGARLIFIAGQVPLDGSGTLVGAGDIAAQAEQVFRNVSAALAAAGAGFRDVIKFNVYMRDVKSAPAYRAARDRHLPPDAPRPTSTLVEVSRLFREDFLIEVEAVAALGS